MNYEPQLYNYLFISLWGKIHFLQNLVTNSWQKERIMAHIYDIEIRKMTLAQQLCKSCVRS
jgi:hypothetical protein